MAHGISKKGKHLRKYIKQDLKDVKGNLGDVRSPASKSTRKTTGLIRKIIDKLDLPE